jgi:hypothetical protein
MLLVTNRQHRCARYSVRVSEGKTSFNRIGYAVKGPESKLVAQTRVHRSSLRTNPKMGYEQTGQTGKLMNVSY